MPSGARRGTDCHTLAQFGPPVGPDPGQERPWVCVSNADGTCPQPWLESLAKHLEAAFQGSVTLNSPFHGGFIIRSHAPELPWIQLEVSRAPFMPNSQRRACVLAALRAWCRGTAEVGKTEVNNEMAVLEDI